MDDFILAVSVGLSAALRKPVNRLLALGAGIGTVAYLNSTDDDPNNDPAVIVDRVRHRIGDIGDQAGPESDVPAGDPGSLLKTWGVIGGAVLTVIGFAGVEKRLLKSPFARVAEGLAVGAVTYSYCQSNA
ncbi:hypothetical protein WG936_08980 [Corynebacterium sp. H127]|uniref:hypothetical protein n=1 Tax=Corynebacterium sp. H127 TaxID=3133418 RepID=UPI0030B46281